MRMLILGGTVFVGWHLTNEALERGHRVTLFNRGKSNPSAFPNAQHLRGDRLAGELTALSNGQWDAVVDVCGYEPCAVKQSAQILASKVQHYTFISSLGVYKDRNAANQDETAGLVSSTDEFTKDITAQTKSPNVLAYGLKKMLCEQEVKAAKPGRTLIIRSGLIAGPRDPSDRFTYWPVRLMRGGNIIAPGSPYGLVQFIDVRDFAQFVLSLIEVGAVGTFNVAGPATPLSMKQLLDACQAETNTDATLHWVSDKFLMENGLRMYFDLPLWVSPEYAGINQFNINKALSVGLIHRPIARTIGDTIAWHCTRPPDYKLRAGLPREQEVELLEKWRQQFHG